jgi:anaerobic selenocysteine-containing dehydrogenase
VEKNLLGKALDEIAEKLKDIKERYGPESLATTIATYRTCLEYWSRFLNLHGTPNNPGQSQICFGPRSVMANAICGMFPHYSVSLASKCIMLLGIDPSVARQATYKVIRDARQKGAKLIVIDPRRTSSASHADIWLQLRHGTDCALLVAI